uniref:U11/U12 small nuclear ribonucleoprotein 25 kDa protein n=1 Tax=Cajanus cajan TaxID=3821 RepID=A0A151SCM4_CAJCA|nr:U11/U12 small nuclear ribonucleoprotein 25 kDa protein [Cajanus cajan]
MRLLDPNAKNPKSPRRSSSLAIMEGILARKTFFYGKLPSQPLRLTVLKLDGSSFHIQVSKTATVAELKDAVEAVFSHVPHKGPAKISWVHVWGQFCLCYDGQKLVTEKDYLRNYGIKDGDQVCNFLRFIQQSASSKPFDYHT